ncbi:MAG: acyl-CoA dehydrogenase family protein, partial [Planctomycetaceae bacterium]
AGDDFPNLCRDLAEWSPNLEEDGAWPAAQLRRLAESKVLGWVIPAEYGGSEISGHQLLTGYEHLASACLTTAFLLTQRNGACQRIALARNESLKAELLPRFLSDEAFPTVGISHLTTSRQHLAQPAVRAVHGNGAWKLSGTVPWVTGGVAADYVVTGGTCEDGRQLLAVVPTATPGVGIDEPPRLLALNATLTGPIVLNEVSIPERFVIAGPIEQVMKQGAGGGTGSLTTSAMALGAARGVLTRLEEESHARADLREVFNSLADERTGISEATHRAAAASESGEADPFADPQCSPESIRQRANSLVLRVAQAYLAASKGAGFVAGHPAERAVREAMFFLVWSCPAPVLAANLREFACLI